MFEVPIEPRSVDRFEAVLPPDEYRAFIERVREDARRLRGRRVWNVNSTARGGGVAEMLRSLLAYAAGSEIEVRWMVLEGEPDFFELTKRLHNRLHGEAGDGGELGEMERVRYRRALEAEGHRLLSVLGPDDVVIVHDPQPAGLIPFLRERGAPVVWRCHIGTDEPNELAREAWRFLLPDVAGADAVLFSRRGYVWDGLDPDRVWIVPPSIDAFAPKNRSMGGDTVRAVLASTGIVAEGDGQPLFERTTGEPAMIRRSTRMIEDRPVPAGAPLVVQVSRWDRLKDPVGVMRSFAGSIDGDAHLILAGPDPTSVPDDPEQQTVLDGCVDAFRASRPAARRRIHLACLPMDDLEENAAIVNALQRRADVVVQKSLAEGFGLTVAEGMWKARPMVASRVGGIQDQIVHPESGLLIDDPLDLPGFATAVASILDDGDGRLQMGHRAHQRIRDRFLAPRHLGQLGEVLHGVLGEGGRRAAS